jgi:BirA family transcriptional regulator, biotin operon repressor / biotin---[acetyl-CoA-carboxylase] ligase
MPATTQDPINPAQLRTALIGTRFAAHLRHFPSVSSTNTLLLEAAAAGAPDGAVYLADEQTAGRGRGNHTWHSAPGQGLYLSALVKPSLPLRDALLLSLAAGLATRQAVNQLSGLEIDLRWPNDLLVGPRKLGGILVEASVEHGVNPLLRHAVIGIGVNVHHTNFPPELAPIATSLTLESHLSIVRGQLAIALLRSLDLEFTRLEDAPDDTASLFARFAEASTWVRGKRVHVPEQGGYTGTTAGLDSRGFLLVDADDGRRRTVLSGGVRAI